MEKSYQSLRLSHVMFDQHYSFRYIMTEHPKGEPYHQLHIYTFYGPHQQHYTVHVEEYPMDIYALKFFLQAHSHSPNKYQLLTGYSQAPRIIRTCIEIFLSLFDQNKESSLCFMGTNALLEEKSENKRFRIYKKVMENFFSPQYFEHRSFGRQSLYFMLNNRKDIEELNKVIVGILDKYQFE